MLTTGQIGYAQPSTRRAAVLLMMAGEYQTAATLLGWVDSYDHNMAATSEVTADLETLVPQMKASLGTDAYEAATLAGTRLTPEEALALSVSELRAGAARL